VLVDCALARLDEEKADLESVALRRRQALERLEREFVQQISQPGESEGSLGWGRFAGKDTKTSLARECDSLSPERGFTDARLSVKEETGWSCAGTIQEVLESSQLLSPAEQLWRCHDYELNASDRKNR
jgi:hypothetical protein